MGTLEAGNRPRDPLPSIGFLDLKDGSGYPPKYPSSTTMATGVGVSSAPLVSPTTTMYPGPPPPYSYQTTSAPPAPRNNEKEQSQPQPPRQSLPSIHEALGNDNPLPYPGPASSPQHAPPPPLSTNLISRPSNDGPTGPPNPFSNNSTSTPFLHSQPGQAGQLPGEASRSSLASVTTQDSRKQSLPSLSSGKSPTQSSNTAATSVSTSQTSASYEYSAPAPASTMASPNGYPPYPQSYSYQSQPPTSQPASYDSRAYVGGGPWKPGTAEPPRVDDAQRGLVSRPIATTQPHSDSVKRQLDGYDVETSLNEIIDISTRTLDFARHYAARAHQTQRSGPILGSLPSVHEVDDLLQLQQRSQEALLRIRAAVLNQEHALAEQRAQRQVYKSDNGYEEEHVPMYQEDFEGGGGFAGADAKKRRGKAAPPGRCHSCNRAETPEWRRGPDGARTLCNACGLHYAKLTRKLGANKASALGSNLKPKSNIESTSPAHR